VRNPTTAVGVVNAAAASVILDDTLDVGTILTLVSEFQNFNPDALQSQQVPTEYSPRGGVAYEEIQWELADPMIEPFRGVEEDGALTTRNVIVDVRGRESIEDELPGLATQLDDVGFDAEVVAGGSLGYDTTIRYGPRGRDAALLLAAHLQGGVTAELDEDIAGYRVVLSVGSDFGGVRSEPLPLEQLPVDLVPPTTDPSTDTYGEDPSGPTVTEPGDPGEGADPSGEDAWDAVDATTTTVPGVAPTDSEAAATCR
jgi:hypothetical protein